MRNNKENFSTILIERSREFVIEFIANNFNEKICYHNIDHTMEVVEASKIIANNCNISKVDLEKVIIASWFHDAGYYLGHKNHELASADIVKKFLINESVNKNTIEKISKCILSTKIPQRPQNILEKIICDADLYHLGTDKFFEKSDLLLLELTLHNNNITTKCWLEQSKEFVEAHKYHTSFGDKFLQPILNQNLALLQLKINKQ